MVSASVLDMAGIMDPGSDFSNATFAGWSADLAADLGAAIVGPGSTYSQVGNIDQVDLPPVDDADLGRIYGPNDASTAFAWDINASATQATMTSFVQLIGRNSSSLAGDWRGLLLDEYSHDRNVDIATERESSDGDAPGVNGMPSTAQFLGELAPTSSRVMTIAVWVLRFTASSTDLRMLTCTVSAPMAGPRSGWMWTAHQAF